MDYSLKDISSGQSWMNGHVMGSIQETEKIKGVPFFTLSSRSLWRSLIIPAVPLLAGQGILAKANK